MIRHSTRGSGIRSSPWVSQARQGGFTLVEMVVALAILTLGLSIVVVAMQNVLARSKPQEAAQRLASSLVAARAEAMKTGRGVVLVDTSTRQVVAFADTDGDNRPGAAERRLVEFTMPRSVTLSGPGVLPAVDGLQSAGSLAWVAYRRNGSVEATGALRIADGRSNFLEVRVAPLATGRVEVRKYDPDLAVNEDGSHWYARGEGGDGWRWN